MCIVMMMFSFNLSPSQFTTGQKQKHSIVGELSYSPFFRTHVKTEPETDAIFFDLTGAAQTENDWQEVSMATTPELIKMECHDVNVECLGGFCIALHDWLLSCDVA